MCRSLWQTPAALTLIRTCVPAGGGVGTSTSFRGALKSVTWKLFIVSLPLARLLRKNARRLLVDGTFLPGKCCRDFFFQPDIATHSPAPSRPARPGIPDPVLQP